MIMSENVLIYDKCVNTLIYYKRHDSVHMIYKHQLQIVTGLAVHK